VTFSNGNPLTAEDVMFTLNLYKDDPIHTIYVMYVDFEKTKIIDDYTIDFWYTEFIVNQATIFSQVLVVDAESYNAEEMSTNPIGTGPYTVTDYVVNSHTTIKARDDYWGEKPAIPNITFKCLNEESQVVNALETNDVDVAQLPISDAEYIKTLDRYTIGESNGGAGVAAFYNMSPDSPLATKEARYAVDYAIDRQSILDVAYGGYGTITNWPASGALLDFEDRFNNLHETYSVGYDIAKAKELAEQSDLVGKSLRIITNGSDQFITAAEIIQADLLEIGVNAEIVNYDQATYYSMLMDVSNFEIALYFTAVPAKVASGIFATTLTTFLPLGWEGPEREAYLKVAGEALTTVDEAERSEKLFETVKMFVEISPWFGICDMLSLQAYVSGLNGMDYYLTGDVRYQNLSFS
jgi:peptide/nickel transport system substrate-binding protein